jgi:hypothetical protein
MQRHFDEAWSFFDRQSFADLEGVQVLGIVATNTIAKRWRSIPQPGATVGRSTHWNANIRRTFRPN